MRKDVTMCKSAGKTFEDGVRLGWLACAIESEGSFQLSWAKRTDGYIQIVPKINIGNKSSEYIEYAMSVSKHYGVGGHISSFERQGMKYLLWYGMKRVKSCIDLILPYMTDIRKKEICGCIKEFVDYRLSVNPHVKYGKIEKDLFLQVRALNGKGMVPDASLLCRFEQDIPERKKSCPHCGIEFVFKKSDHIFCSRKCCERARNLKKESSTTNTPNTFNVKIESDLTGDRKKQAEMTCSV